MSNEKEEEWEEVQAAGDLLTLEKPGDSVIGKIKEKQEGIYGPRWVIETEGGDLVTPSHKVLQSRLQNVSIGATVKIERLEDLPPAQRGFNPTTMYKVSVKKG